MSEVVGLDFAWSKPDPQDTWNKGYRFVLGYISNDPSKDLNANQIAAYRHAGLGVHLVFETLANEVLGGAAAGARDGAQVEQRLNALGENLTSPVFFAVDFDAQPYQYPTIQAYANAFNMQTRRPVGIYGSFAVVEHFVTPGRQPVQYGWQTVAWSGSNLSQKCNFYQRNTHHYPIPAGTSASGCDEDVLIHDLP